MGDKKAQQQKDFARFLHTRIKAVDKLEREIDKSFRDDLRHKRDCETRIAVRGAAIVADLPFDARGRVDRSQRGKVREARKAFFALMDREQARLERALLPPGLRKPPSGAV